MTARDALMATFVVANIALAAVAFRVEHEPSNWDYREDDIEWSQLQTRLDYLGSGGWELIALARDRKDPARVWGTYRRRGRPPGYRKAPPPPPKQKGRGPTPVYHESPL